MVFPEDLENTPLNETFLVLGDIMNYQRIQFPVNYNQYNLAYFVAKIKSNKKAISWITVAFVVGILIIAAISQANHKATVKVENSNYQLSKYQLIDQFDQKIETLITGQNDPTDLEKSEKFNPSSYFLESLSYANAHALVTWDDLGWNFDTKVSKLISDKNIFTDYLIKEKSTSAKALRSEKFMKALHEEYVKLVVGFFQLMPEDLDNTPKYFCEVFGFCEFLKKDQWHINFSFNDRKRN
jgi:hypothetical protein